MATSRSKGFRSKGGTHPSFCSMIGGEGKSSWLLQAPSFRHLCTRFSQVKEPVAPRKMVAHPPPLPPASWKEIASQVGVIALLGLWTNIKQPIHESCGQGVTLTSTWTLHIGNGLTSTHWTVDSRLQCVKFVASDKQQVCVWLSFLYDCSPHQPGKEMTCDLLSLQQVGDVPKEIGWVSWWTAPLCQWWIGYSEQSMRRALRVQSWIGNSEQSQQGSGNLSTEQLLSTGNTQKENWQKCAFDGRLLFMLAMLCYAWAGFMYIWSPYSNASLVGLGYLIWFTCCICLPILINKRFTISWFQLALANFANFNQQ